MRFVPIAEAAEVNPKVPKTLAEDPTAPVTFLPMARVSEGGFISDAEVRPVGEVLKGYRYFERGDVLFAKITPCMENGKATIAEQVPHKVGFGSTEFHVLRPSAETDARYLFYMVWNSKFRFIAERNMTGTAGQKRVPTDFVKRFKIPLPPLAEQKRIAAILDKADAIRRKRQEAIALTEEFLRSAYIDMVGPGHPDYESWPEVEMKTLALEGKGNMRTGPFGSALKHSEFVDEGIAVLGIDNAVQNRFAWSQRRFITPAKYEGLKRYTVRPNDVIVTIMGTTGRSAVVPADIPLAITTKHLATITVDSRKAVPEYVSNAVHRDPVVLHQIAMRNRGAVMPGLNLGIIKELKVRLPPLSQQQLFDTALKEARQLERRLQSNNDTSNNLFNSLVQRAFRGEL